MMGLLLPSGNDAAETIAVYIGRKDAGDMSLDETKAIERFMWIMNERAKQAGATNTNFVNPHGYHDKNHYTTAHDLALITKEAMKFEFFREAVKTFKYNADDKPVFNGGQVTETVDHIWKNSNDLIDKSSKNYYEYSTGIKTGYTTPAGFCIVSSASKDGMDLIAVVLNSTSQGRWTDPQKLLEYGFENYGYYNGAEKDKAVAALKVDNPSSYSPENLTAVPEEDFAGTFNKEDAAKIQKNVVWDESIMAPVEGEENKIKLLSSIETGDVIGKEVFTLNGSVIKEINLKAMEGVKMQSIVTAAAATVGSAINIGVDNILWFFAGVICGNVGLILLVRAAKRRRRSRRYGYRNLNY
jgi:D-alanyl-D-alanine carboxypeptidase (penicillin-binding protein 5/6)